MNLVSKHGREGVHRHKQTPRHKRHGRRVRPQAWQRSKAGRLRSDAGRCRGPCTGAAGGDARHNRGRGALGVRKAQRSHGGAVIRGRCRGASRIVALCKTKTLHFFWQRFLFLTRDWRLCHSRTLQKRVSHRGSVQTGGFGAACPSVSLPIPHFKTNPNPDIWVT